MGRVKRYKKFKACDPFSKQFNRREIDNVHDEPPNIFDDKTERIVKKAKRKENNSMLQIRKFAKLTDHTAVSSVTSIKDEIKKIEGKREDETMKTFKKRLRQETRETLRDEIRGLTATAQKKKLRLKERKQQRKKGKVPEHLDSNGKKSREDRDDDETLDREFGASETGQLRASDMDGAKMTFDATDADEVKFGERVEAPPDLRFSFKMAGAKKIGLGQDESDGKTAGKRFAEMQSQRKEVKLSASDDRIRKEGTLYNPGQKATGKELEATRNKVIAAYKELQKKRKEENMN